MGGYGALRLAVDLGPERVSAVVAASPAVWRDASDARPDGFEDEEEYERYSVMDEQDQLGGIPVRIDCGTGDPLYREVEALVDGFPDDADLTSTLRAGRPQRGVLAPDAARAARVPRHASSVVGVSELEFRTVGLGDEAVDYLAAWDLQREVHARVADRDQAPTVLLLEHPPVYTAGKRTLPARAARSTPVARRSSTSTAAARSPSTAPASWSATRSCRCPTTSRSSTTYAASRRR